MSVLEAAEQLLAEGFRPRRGIVMAFGHDEEISGMYGAALIAERMKELGLHFQWMVDEGGMILADSPMLPGKSVAMINVAEKGYMTLTLVVTGEGGHSSNPPQVSTIGRLSNALARIEANPFPPRLVGPVEAMFESLAPHVGQPERFVFENLWLTAPLVARNMADQRLTLPFVKTTTALTMFNAGVKENVVPQRAEAKVNFRLLPGDTPDSVLERIEEIVDDPQVDISYQRWQNIPPVSDHEGPGFAAISEAVRVVYPEAVVVPSLLVATTDTRHYIDLADDQYRFHGMLLESTQASSVHGSNEYIAIDSYLNTIAIARHAMRLGAR
jgi:carboxypeptidase PM20D1